MVAAEKHIVPHHSPSLFFNPISIIFPLSLLFSLKFNVSLLARLMFESSKIVIQQVLVLRARLL